MGFEEVIGIADSGIIWTYERLISERYSSLFQTIKDKAIPHMRTENIPKIPLGITYKRVVFNSDGEFYDYNKEQDKPDFPSSVNLIGLAKLYQRQSDYIAEQADDRSHHTPDIHTAMRSALIDFMDKVKKSLADVL